VGAEVPIFLIVKEMISDSTVVIFIGAMTFSVGNWIKENRSIFRIIFFIALNG